MTHTFAEIRARLKVNLFSTKENRVTATKARISKLISCLEDQDYLLENLILPMPDDSIEKDFLLSIKSQIIDLLGVIEDNYFDYLKEKE